MKKVNGFIITIAALLIMPLHSHAWGLQGHRIVGAIAETYLTKNAKAAIKKILGNETLAACSNWADFIKSDSAYAYISPWHYINLPDSLNETEVTKLLKKDTAADAFTKLNFIIAQLKNKSLAKDKKKMYLRLLVHIAGDVHQPMHVSREADQGGNLIRVSWFGTSSNLHRVWDENLIASQQYSYTEYASVINFTTLQQRKKWQAQPITHWFFDSYQISQHLYKNIPVPDAKLSYRYIYDNIDTLNMQLLKGGVHLAGLLNSIFK